MEQLKKAFRFLFRSLFVVTASVCLTGGSLFLLQIAAWSWMIATYSTDDDLASAISDTFSGERPCPLCEMISETKQESEPITHQKEVEKLKLLSKELTPVRFLSPKRASVRLLCATDVTSRVVRDVDPPPPRG